MKDELKKRYQEKFDEGSELLWPSEKEDSITRKFYRDISHLSKNLNHRNKKTSFLVQITKIIMGKGGSPLRK